MPGFADPGRRVRRSGAPPVFVDTNVLVYARDPSDPEKQRRAAEWMAALWDEGTGRVLSSPKIATQNNERAEIEQGVRIPIVNTTATEINVEFVSASLKMIVTPQITAEGTIILEVEVENNAPDFVNTAGGIPSINTQRAQTTVLISDGGTTVIGGIFTVNEGRSEQGVPWFRKLPVFGWLFKQQNITNTNRELLIFITPKIMRVA